MARPFKTIGLLVPLFMALTACPAKMQSAPPQSASALIARDAASPNGDAAPAPSPPMGQQWLYGSAEGAVAAQQSYRALTQYVLDKANHRPSHSVVFASGATIANPRFIECGERPFAVVFDADETLVWNLGAMRWFAENNIEFNSVIWDSWEKTGAGKARAMPGAIKALAELRAAGITVIANTNRTSTNAAGTEATLRAAGLGAFKHGETLFLMGDDDTGSSKDRRRETISQRYCVLALAGDQLGDFLQAFNASGLSPADRKALAQSDHVASLWGNGWFLFANSVYGPSIRGDFDEIFPADARWEPTTGSK